MKRKTQWLGILLMAIGAGATAQDWAQWRGPERDGHTGLVNIPASWPEKLEKVWSLEIGASLSSPVVADGLVYQITRDDPEEVVSCVALADGKKRWESRYKAPFFANGGAVSPRFYPVSKGMGPFATPVLKKDRLYTMGVSRILTCFDAKTGKQIWQKPFLHKDLPTDIVYVCPPCGCSQDGQEFKEAGRCPDCNMQYNPRGLETSAKMGGGNYYGSASSPLLDEERLYIHVGNPETGRILALDPQSGSTLWQWEGDMVAYVSPILGTVGGVRQLITMNRKSLVGLDPEKGRLLWQFPIANNAHLTSPILYKDLLITAEYQGPVFALSLSLSEGKWQATKAWQNDEMKVWLNSMVLEKDRLYGFFTGKRGQYGVLDAQSGEDLWVSEGRQGTGANLVLAGDTFLALKSDGQLEVLGAGLAGLESKAAYKVADLPVWTHPVVMGRSVLVKDEGNLSLWRW